MRLVCISDTHNRHKFIPSLPDGDVLVHAGDWTGTGSVSEVEDFVCWFDEIKHYKYKVCIAGNHDWAMQGSEASRIERVMAECGIHYLNQHSVELDGIKFYGAPYQPEFCGWAFNVPRRSIEMKKIWDAIPLDTQVLVTHGPPYGVLDETPYGVKCGCEVLRRRILDLGMLKAHIFGHIHHGYGTWFDNDMGITYVNAAICDERYRPINQPLIIEV